MKSTAIIRYIKCFYSQHAQQIQCMPYTTITNNITIKQSVITIQSQFSFKVVAISCVSTFRLPVSTKMWTSYILADICILFFICFIDDNAYLIITGTVHQEL